MIKLTVMYPHTPGAHFDHDYYRDVHLPLLKARMGDALLYYSIEKGLAGMPPGSDPVYVALCHVHCASLETLMASVGPHLAEIVGDVKNFTTITPVQQVSEVVVERGV